jgi:adenine nucleotide transporter 17
MSLSEVFSYSALVHASAGTAGGSTAMTVFYPLDAIRTRIQSGKDSTSVTETFSTMVKEDGIANFYAGLRPVLISLGVSNFVYFYANNLLKVLIKRATQKDVTVLQNLFIASVAGVINVMMTCPLWVANTRLRLQRRNAGASSSGKKPYDGMLDALTRIAQEEGVLSLWNGAQASLLLVSNPTIHFVVYDKVMSIFSARANALGRTSLTSGEIFMAGAVAKTCATIVTYPIQLAQTRLRNAASKQKKAKKGEESGSDREVYANTLDVLLKVYSKNGVLGWYAGLNIKVVQTVLTAAFQFLCYEQIKDIIFKLLM